MSATPSAWPLGPVGRPRARRRRDEPLGYPFVISPNEQAAAAEFVADSLAAALGRLFPGRIGVAPVRPPHERASSVEAYRLYMVGQGRLARREQSVNEATELFRQAIKEDSLFAPAYSGLSMALSLMPWFHRVPSTVVQDEIVVAAHRALALTRRLRWRTSR